MATTLASEACSRNSRAKKVTRLLLLQTVEGPNPDRPTPLEFGRAAVARFAQSTADARHFGHQSFSACGAELRRFVAKNPRTIENDREKFSCFGSEAFML